METGCFLPYPETLDSTGNRLLIYGAELGHFEQFSIAEGSLIEMAKDSFYPYSRKGRNRWENRLQKVHRMDGGPRFIQSRSRAQFDPQPAHCHIFGESEKPETHTEVRRSVRSTSCDAGFAVIEAKENPMNWTPLVSFLEESTAQSYTFANSADASNLDSHVVTCVESNRLRSSQIVDCEIGGEGGNRTRDRGFADLGLTTWRPRR
jgi:hypothetical protein